MRASLYVLALAMLVAVTAPAGAVLITSNLGADDGLNFAGYGIHAQRFTTDARDYVLDDVVLRVASFPRSSTIAGVEALLWSHDSAASAPGSVLASFIVPSLPADAFGEAVFTPAAPVALAASTSYWVSLVHASSSGGGVQWRGAVTGAGDVGPGFIDPRSSVSLDGGLTWVVNSNQSLKLAVNGTPRGVAEPLTSTLLTSGFGLSLLTMSRRRANR